jgi:REP element-mobilizing transposase RayT
MRPKRLKTFDYVGCYHYSLTFCAFRRNRYFEDSALVGLVQEQLSRTATEHQFEELAYCFVPDHLHLLLAGLREDASLIPCVEVMRQRSSRAAKTAQGIQLWQDGYFERVLRASNWKWRRNTSSRIPCARIWWAMPRIGYTAVDGSGGCTAGAQAKAWALVLPGSGLRRIVMPS